MIQTVFLDVDGVLADFTVGAHRKLGFDLSYSHWPYSKGPSGWDWNKELGITFNGLSAVCDYEFWATLPWTEDGRDILREVLRVFDKSQIVLLTAPMPHIMSASGKMAWIESHLPEYAGQTIICAAPKAVVAGPENLLIDDSQENTEKWSKKGPKILVPRPWNMRYGDFFAGDAVGYIKCQLDLIEILNKYN